MATLTIRNLPDDVVKRLKEVAARNKRSMEQEVRELLQEKYAKRAEILRRIRESWKTLPETSAEEVNRWIKASRRRGLTRGR
jgi:plasmid stability protein